MLAIMPAIVSLRHEGPFVFDRAVARRATKFGPAAWLWELSSLSNARLDQLLMVKLVSARELGLYAIAVTASGMSTVFLSAIGPALLPKVARGAHDLAPRACRLSLLATAAGAVSVGVAGPFLVPLLFGPAFRAAVPMLEILLLAGVPATGVQVLSSALLAGDRPRWTAAAEAAAVFVTIPGLILLLPGFGGVGAAAVSLVAYSVTFGVLLIGARRRFAVAVRVFLIPRVADALVLCQLAVNLLRRLKLLRGHDPASPRH
jgi:O-antigen/teichoic acid export membrane protein